MVELFVPFSKIQKQKILVIGDFVLDTYTIGKAQRISPEAPVPILHVHHEEHRPGMAGNVALNLVSMGIEAIVAGRVGNDGPGQTLLKALQNEGIDTRGILVEQDFFTPVKNRIIAHNQQIVRVDHEKVQALHELVEQRMIEELGTFLPEVQLIAVSDYGKGTITRSLMAFLIEASKRLGIPLIVDPKGLDFSKYAGAALVKPNSAELYAAANLPLETPIEEAARVVLKNAKADVLMVTRSEEGISLFYQEGQREDFPVRSREVKDVTGAGDTVLAMLACALANGLSFAEAARLANIAAGLAIEKFGCARITLSEVATALLKEDAQTKVFDQAHLSVLRRALNGRKFALLVLSSKKGLSTEVVSLVREVALKDNWDLLIVIEEADPDPAFIETLASLHYVDYILVNGGSIDRLVEELHPHQVITSLCQKGQ